MFIRESTTESQPENQFPPMTVFLHRSAFFNSHYKFFFPSLLLHFVAMRLWCHMRGIIMTSERFEFASPPKRVTHSGAWFLNSLMASSVLEFTAFLAMCGFFLLFRAPAMMLSVVLGQARFIVVVVVRVDKDAENCFLIPPRLMMIVNLSNASEVFIFRWLVIARLTSYFTRTIRRTQKARLVLISWLLR